MLIFTTLLAIVAGYILWQMTKSSNQQEMKPIRVRTEQEQPRQRRRRR